MTKTQNPTFFQITQRVQDELDDVLATCMNTRCLQYIVVLSNALQNERSQEQITGFQTTGTWIERDLNNAPDTCKSTGCLEYILVLTDLLQNPKPQARIDSLGAIKKHIQAELRELKDGCNSVAPFSYVLDLIEACIQDARASQEG